MFYDLKFIVFIVSFPIWVFLIIGQFCNNKNSDIAALSCYVSAYILAYWSYVICDGGACMLNI